MSVLTHDEIVKEIRKGNIDIRPFDPKQVGPGSVDLHLSNEFRLFNKVHEIVHVRDVTDHRKYTRRVRVKDYLLLMPGDSVQGITREKVRLPANICGWLEGRSRFARLGLLVHISAGFIQPGINNRQVLEINNMSQMPLAVYPGTAICQLILERCEGSANYSGRYMRQGSV